MVFLGGLTFGGEVEEFGAIQPDAGRPLARAFSTSWGNSMLPMRVISVPSWFWRADRHLVEARVSNWTWLFLVFAVFVEGRLIGVDDHDAGVAVDDELSPELTSWVIFSRPTTAGMPMELAMMAVWLVLPPASMRWPAPWSGRARRSARA